MLKDIFLGSSTQDASWQAQIHTLSLAEKKITQLQSRFCSSKPWVFMLGHAYFSAPKCIGADGSATAGPEISTFF